MSDAIMFPAHPPTAAARCWTITLTPGSLRAIHWFHYKMKMFKLWTSQLRSRMSHSSMHLSQAVWSLSGQCGYVYYALQCWVLQYYYVLHPLQLSAVSGLPTSTRIQCFGPASTILSYLEQADLWSQPMRVLQIWSAYHREQFAAACLNYNSFQSIYIIKSTLFGKYQQNSCI